MASAETIKTKKKIKKQQKTANPEGTQSIKSVYPFKELLAIKGTLTDI